MLAPGKGAVFVWGSLVEIEGEIFIQSYVEFLRKDRPLLMTFDMPSPGGRSRYFGSVPQSGIGLSPRILTNENIAEIRESAAETRMLSSQPGALATIPLPDGLAETFAFFVTEIDSNGWMRIRAATTESDFQDLNSLSFDGWPPAKPAWSLRSLLPELEFVDATVGFLVAQIIEEERQADHWAGNWAERYVQARSKSVEALDRFLEVSDVGAEEVDIDTAASMALAMTMRAAMTLNGPPVEPVELKVPEAPGAAEFLFMAVRDLEQSKTLIPFYPETRNLLAIALSAVAAVEGDDAKARLAAAEWQDALSLAPGNLAVSGNLSTYYRAASTAERPDLVGLTQSDIKERLKFLKPSNY